MRVAIVDLGTNSVRFDIHQLGPGDRYRELHREKLMVRLGQGVFLQGKLDAAAIRRTLQAFESFQATATSLHCDKLIAYGTSALREASDSDKLLTQIRSQTGIDVRVISGEEEARLIARGILANEKNLSAQGRFALVDIGGGSTEITLCRGRAVLHSESFPLGTARLQQVFLKSTPPDKDSIEKLRRTIKSILLPKLIADDWGTAPLVIGSSGTIRTLSRILRDRMGKKGLKKPIDRGALRKLVKEMSLMSTTELLNIPGMEPKRVDMILAGAILLEECLDAIKAKRLKSTEYTLRDGMLEEEIELFRDRQTTPLAFHLDSLYAKAKRLGVSEEHLLQVAHLSGTLFDRLRRVHRLPLRWRHYLVAAAIMHDAGEAISPTGHEKHSYYIVKNADFPSMEKWEVEFVAQLCLRHAGGKFEVQELRLGGNKERSKAFIALLAILRIADALDRGHKGYAKIRSVKVTRKQVRVSLSRGNPTDLEKLRVEQKRELFEKVFRKELVVS